MTERNHARVRRRKVRGVIPIADRVNGTYFATRRYRTLKSKAVSDVPQPIPHETAGACAHRRSPPRRSQSQIATGGDLHHSDRTHGRAEASMNSQLNHVLAQQRGAELRRDAEETRFSRELPSIRSRPAPGLKHRPDPCATGFTLHGHQIAKLDRFVGQAQRAARRAGREFDGVSVEVDHHGVVSVHASGVMSMLL
jgi:hypothetical protein